MDTQTAILNLQTLSQNMGAQKDVLALNIEAIAIASAQLQGLLDTVPAELSTAHTKIADLTIQVQHLVEQNQALLKQIPNPIP